MSHGLVNRIMPSDIIKIRLRYITVEADRNSVYPVRIPMQLRAAQQPEHATYQFLGVNTEGAFNRMARGLLVEAGVPLTNDMGTEVLEISR